jgi:tetratricopeptide (TPR) repeat protein
VPILRRKVEALSGSDALAPTRLKLAELYEKELSDPERAAEVYRAVADQDGTNLIALAGLERVYRTLQRWSELVDVLEKQLQSVQSERERVGVLLRLATLQEQQFLKSDVAAQRYERALEIDPTEIKAYEGLENCYRRLKQWQSLVNCFERHIEEVSGHDEKVRLLGEIGRVYAEELNEPEQAIAAYQRIVDLQRNNIGALDALAKLYEKRGDVHESIECLTRVAELTSEGGQRVDMYYRIGRAQLERLDDAIGARESLEKALDLDPAHAQALSLLKGIALREGDWDAAGRLLEQEVAHTKAERAKAKLFVELGKLRDEKLGERESALQAYEQAIQSDPESEEAAGPLLESYYEQGRWKEAEPLAELLVRRGRGQDRGVQHRLNNMLGKIHAELGHDEQSLKAYQAAFQLDVTSQESVRGIAEISYRLKDWPTALSNYQKVLTALGDDELDQRTEVYYRLGCIKREQGQLKQAINNYEKALGLNGEHRPTLDALIEVYEKQGDWKQVAEYKRQILDSISDEGERYNLLLDIGEVWGKKAENTQKAVEALEEAQTLRPRDHVVLHRLLQMYQKLEEWSKMIETILAISELEEDVEKKARYYFTVAQLYRDKVEDADRAVEYFNESLDLHPGYLEAFERINKILTHSKNWKQLERNYRKMLHRVAGKGKAELEHELWYQLGLIYRDRIQDRDKAIDAFKMASHTKPEELQDRRILSELYEVSEQYDEAIVHQRYILEQDPLKLDPYRSLYRLFLYKRSYDEAWCAASAMVFLHKAEAEEQRFFDDYKPQGILAVKGRLSNEHWVKYLLHPRLNPFVSKILEAVAGAALKAKITQLGANYKAPDKKFKQDVASSTITFARTFGWGAQVLGIPIPELYVRNDAPGTIEALATDPKASEAGRGVLSGFQPPELAFICGKHLAGYRPELYLKNLFPGQNDLTVMLFAGVILGAPNTPLPPELASNVQTTAKALNPFLDAQARDYLRTVVKRFIAEGAKANIKQWMAAAELTACRTGLLISGDLEIAKKILSSERATPELPAAEKMKDLLTFIMSDQYSALRRALGINIPAE